MKILKTPWKSEFLDLVQNSNKNIRISSPFVKETICDELLKVKRKSSKIDFITSFKLTNLYSGSLDLGGIEKIVNSDNSEVRNHSKVHSKIYIFDENKAIITSGNLTNGGLLYNYEYGVYIENDKIIYDIIDDFEKLFQDETTGTIKQSDITSVRKILSKIPKSSKISVPQYDLKEDSPTENILLTETNNIFESLTGWKKQVFAVADKIEEQEFSLNDIYSFEKELSELYPNNKNIKDKIRQQLQLLRDLSLIEFLGYGKYRKQWKQSDKEN